MIDATVWTSRFLISHCMALAFCGSLTAQQATPSTWSLVEELRIGDLDDPSYALTEVGGIILGRDGSMFVSQPRDYRIRVYDVRGRFVRVIGRRGQGPGEFSSIHGLGWLGDTLWVTDPVASRVSRFARDGRLISSQRIEGALLPNVGRPLTPGAVLPGGRILTSALMRARGPNDRSQEVILEMSAAGAVMGGYGSRNFSGALTRVVVGTQSVHFVQPFRNIPYYALAPRGSHLVTVDQRLPTSTAADTFRVTAMRAPGDTIFSVGLAFRPTRTPPAVRDSITSAARASMAHIGVSARVSSLVLDDSLRVPAFLPPVHQLLTSDDGRVLLGDADLGSRGIKWTVLSRSGEVVATFTTPGGVRLLAFQGDQCWGVIRDEMDVPYAVRYRLRGSGVAVSVHN